MTVVTAAGGGTAAAEVVVVKKEKGAKLEARLVKDLYDGDGIGRLRIRAWNLRRLPDTPTRMGSPAPAFLTRSLLVRVRSNSPADARCSRDTVRTGRWGVLQRCSTDDSSNNVKYGSQCIPL